MIYVINRSINPYFNMAVEEYLFTAEKFQQDIFLLWQNDNTIVVGRHQNTLEEINTEYVKKKLYSCSPPFIRRRGRLS